MKKWLSLLFCLFSLFACSLQQKESSEDTVKVGTISGPETELIEVAKQVAKDKYNLTIEIIPFSDYAIPNIALAEGSIDANIFQHLPYLKVVINTRHYDLTPVAKTFIYPMGVYSKQYKNIDDLPEQASIAIPNDPSNEARALLLLQKAGLLTLKDRTDKLYTVNDIITNRKKIQIKTLAAAQLARVMPDVDAVVINTNYAVPAGLRPLRDAIYIEDKDSDYANLIVVRAEDINKPKITQLIAAVQSDEVKQAANKIFTGQAIAAW